MSTRCWRARLACPKWSKLRTGTSSCLARKGRRVVDQAPSGRMYKDGSLLIGAADSTVAERRRLSFAGVVSVALALDLRGELLGDPAFEISGLPQVNRNGTPFEDVIEEAILNVVERPAEEQAP